MITQFDKILERYNYHLPPELIAQAPAKPRDSARLLIFDRTNKKVAFDVFSNLGKYLPKNAVLVFNQTKVVPARLTIKKPTGGKVEILYLDHDKNFLKVLANKKLLINTAYTLYSGRLKPHTLTVAKKINNHYYLKPSFPIAEIVKILKQYGKTPLPPYIKHSPLNEKQKREQYQTVFAKTGLSVAAPTASLHFTKQLIAKLRRQGIKVKFITLNVNLGTFAPLTEDQLSSGKLHSESYQISASAATALNKAKKTGHTIIAVGTTAVRALESATQNQKLKNLSGSTRLFISPGYKFRFIDGLITNFHVPKSSLLMLVSALTGRSQLLKAYNQAIRKKFRFFSFGDGMLIL